MTTKIAWTLVVAAGLALPGCTTKDAPQETGMATPNDDGDDPSTGPAATDDGDGATDTGPGDDDDGTPDPDGGGGSFIVELDNGGISFECDMFAQDCPEGEKCMPWANNGGSAWNATRCSPIADNPGQAGDMCAVEGSGVSGVDDCDLGHMCWDVDPETNTGTCVAMCTGDSSSPICEDPDTACAIVNEGAIVLCLPSCDPLLQDCPENQACYPIEENFQCVPDASGESGAYSDPCEFINACDAGLACLGAAAVPDCTGSAGCCSEVCDLTDPAGDGQCTGSAGGQTCQPWYEDPPPGYENVGICALPG